MAKDNKSRFRVTAWPQTPLPSPNFLRQPHRWDSRERVLLADLDAIPAPATATGQIYLELLDLDLTSSEAILMFTNRFGPLGTFDPVTGGWPAFENSPASYEALRRLEEARKNARTALVERQRDYERRLAESDFSPETAMKVRLAIAESSHPEDDASMETRDEFLLGARHIRDATRAWIGIREDARLDELAFETPILEEATDRAPHWSVRSSLDVRGFLDGFLAFALIPFRPQIRIGVSCDPSGHHPDEPAIALSSEMLEVAPLYSVCALELFNHIVEGADFRVCANESCRARFVHQDGRSAKGRHRRIGVKYHTAACARAQTQREYRRRQRRNRVDVGS